MRWVLTSRWPLTVFIISLCSQLQAQTPQASPKSSVSPLTSEQATTTADDDTSVDSGRPAVALPRVEIRANDDTEMRRRSTAAKIIIGRDDIERYGDTSMGELLKRLPGVTVQGRPGRGGAPRMRGLGGGYTQILVDGERVPRGFSLDEISPEDIERIEILRAPTAETGARAIAGTINIITRGGYTRHVNNLNLVLALEHGQQAPSASWSRNDTIDKLNYNFTVAAVHGQRSNDSRNETLTENLANGNVLQQSETLASSSTRDSVHASGRLQWRLAQGDSLTLMPMLLVSQNTGTSQSWLTQSGSGTSASSPYDSSSGSSNNHFSLTRLAGIWIHNIDDGSNLRLSASASQSAWNNDTSRQNISNSLGTIASTDQQSEQHDSTLNIGLKYSRSLASEHNLVSGLELESNRRDEHATTQQTGQVLLDDADDNLRATSLRTAAYIQDEWNLNPNWALHAGVRWEGISTSGSVSADSAQQNNRSAVLTPLLHAVWRPDLAVKDQLRLSLTRSYRSPDLQALIAQTTINPMFLNRGPNDELHPDRASNPYLKPELASGLDLAYEHYVNGGGLLSANVFYRQIQNYMRSQTALETVSWADVQRWVARRQNIGNAHTLGLELDAKFRLSEIFLEAPKVDLRANLSLFRSSVEGVPTPDNRLDQQPDGTFNLGADYQLRGIPLKVGGNLNWTPQFSTRLSEDQTVYQSNKFVADAYLLWTLDPNRQLRISLGNLAGRDYITAGSLLSINPLGQVLRESTQSIAPSYVSVQVKLEIKL
jgi:iron complex outermembrane receptor protein